MFTFILPIGRFPLFNNDRRWITFIAWLTVLFVQPKRQDVWQCAITLKTFPSMKSSSSWLLRTKILHLHYFGQLKILPWSIWTNSQIGFCLFHLYSGTNKRFHKMTIVGAVFEQKNLSDGMRYCTSSNKHWVSNKHCTFGYPHKCLPLISTAPLLSAASLNTELTRRITVFYKKLNQNAYEPSM